jgi:amylosucrase
VLVPFDARSPHVVGYQRPKDGDVEAPTVVLCLANMADGPVRVEPLTLSGFEAWAENLLAGGTTDLSAGLTIPAHGITWLRVQRAGVSRPRGSSDDGPGRVRSTG